MRDIHYLNKRIWFDGPYESSDKQFFQVISASNFKEIPRDQAIQFVLEGYIFKPKLRTEIANLYTRLIKDETQTQNELNSKKMYCKLQIISDNIVRFQLNSKPDQFEHDTPMVIGTFPKPNVTLHKDKVKYSFENDQMKIDLVKNPFKLKIYNKITGKISFETQDFNESYIQCGWNLVTGQLIDEKKKYPVISMLSLKIKNNEHFYGGGELFGSLDKREQRIYLDIQDPTTTDTENHYKAIPYYMSSNNYGLFVNQSVPMIFDFGKDSYRGVSIKALQDFLDVFIFIGKDMKELLDLYTDLTGKCKILPPKWSFGLWMSRISYRSEREIYDTIAKMREYHIPFDVIHIDTDWFTIDWACDFKFDKMKYPHPEQMIKDAHKNHVKVSLWQLPYIDPRLDIYDEGKKRGFFAQPSLEIQEMIDAGLIDQPAGVIDFSIPEAIKWYQDLLRPLLEMGIDVIKVDFGESAYADLSYKNITGVEMHNLYPLIYNKLQYELSQEIKSTPIIWARSAWAGSQRYPVHWAGDSKADLRSMYSTLRGGLNFGMCGFTFWSHDMGGFTPRPSEETYQRWIQLGFWTSHSRCHGEPPREPYTFSDALLENFKKYDYIKYQLLPYIYSQAQSCIKKGLPLLRSMILEFEYHDDPTLYVIDDQYMFGDSFLVAPIFEYGISERKIYFPDGLWYDFETLELIRGPKWISYPCPIDKIPVFVKANSIIPMIKPIEYIPDQPFKDITIYYYPEFDRDGKLIEQTAEFSYHDEEEDILIKVECKKSEIKLIAPSPKFLSNVRVVEKH